MTIRTLPGQHTEVFVYPEQLNDLCRELYRWEHMHKYMASGHVVNGEVPVLTLRDGEQVLRFRLPAELNGISPEFVP